MSTSSKPLPQTYDHWLEEHSKELQDSRKKSFESSSGILVETLYTPEHLQHAAIVNIFGKWRCMLDLVLLKKPMSVIAI